MAEKNFAISVIVPMFNAENFIGECLTSLANQTFQNFEVIIVDDCSTDNSLNVALTFSKVFGDRLRLAKLSANSGCPGVPRNFALEAARGEYIFFLDSDDFLAETALENFFTVAKNFDADVVHADWFITAQNFGGKFEFKQQSFQAGNFVDEPTLETFDIGERVTGFIQKKFLWWACNKLFRRKLLTENKITFPAIKIFEDFVFSFECLVAAKNYVRVPFANYCYRLRENSVSQKILDAIGQTETLIGLVGALDRFMNTQKFFSDDPKYRYALLDFFMQERIEVLAERFFVKQNFSPAEVFEIFREKIFSEESAALTAYLFVASLNSKLEVEN